MSAGTPVTIPATDGFPLAATWYEPAGGAERPGAERLGAEPDDALVLLCSATGVKRSFYAPYARFLAERGLAALTFDYRGIGGSRPPSLRGFGARMRDWGERDLDGVLAWAEREHPRRALRVVGHSVGGQILDDPYGFFRERRCPARWAASAEWLLRPTAAALTPASARSPAPPAGA